MQNQEQNKLAERKAAFLKLYQDHPEITMFQAAVQSALTTEVLASELRTDREFFAKVKELCGQKVKNEITAYQQNTKNDEGTEQPRPGNN